MTNKHSDKAMKTLEAMGTTATDWKQADIRWVVEKRMMMRPVTCPTCDGERRIYVMPDSEEEVVRPEGMLSWQFQIFARENKFRERRCQTCFSRKEGWSTGRVLGPKLVEVMVGYPVWPQGTRFDSRFRSAVTDRYCCELCSKSLKSYQVPCVGRGADGVAHGMWVGMDCAKKFLAGIQIYPPAEAKKRGLEVVMDEVKS